MIQDQEPSVERVIDNAINPLIARIKKLELEVKKLKKVKPTVTYISSNDALK